MPNPLCMRSFFNKLLCSGLSLSLFLAGVGALANLEALQENSPFLPPDFKPRGSGSINRGGKEGPARRLELTGMIQVGAVWSFSFYEPAKKRSFWAKMGDPAAEVKIVDFNPQHKTVTLEAGGTRDVVSLRQSTPPTGAPLAKGPALNGAAIGGSGSKKGGGMKPDKPADLPPLSPEDETALKMLEELLLGLGGAGGPGNGPK